MLLPSPIDDLDLTGFVIPEDISIKNARRFQREMMDRRNKVFHVPPPMSPTKWVYENIDLKGKNISQIEGKLRYLSYQRALSDSLMDSTCTEVTVLKGTRIGWSLFIASFAMYVVGYLGQTITIAQPTDGDAEAFYAEVINKMIKCCPTVEAMRMPGTWDIIQFSNGGIIRLIGGTSADNFRRFDSKFNFIDEYSADGYDNKKGDQGDKLQLFKDRGGAWRHTVTGSGSSPLSKDDCRTFARFMVSDKRYPYIPCPNCGLSQIMDWGEKDSKFGFKWKCDEVTGHVVDAWYQCPSEKCHSEQFKITDDHRRWLDENMDFIPTTHSESPGHHGYHVPQWISAAGQSSYIKIAQRFIDAQGKPELLKTFTNNVRAWVWDQYTTSDMDAKVIATLLRPYEAEVPDDVIVLTAGIDKQDNKEGSVLERLASREVQVVGWNALGQFRVIGHWIVLGEPGDPSSDRELKAILDRPYHKKDGSRWYIQAAAHDFGGQDHADEIRLFCNGFGPDRNIWAIKGHNHRKDFVFPRARSTSTRGAHYYVIDSHNARDEIFRLMQLQGDKQPLVPRALGGIFLDRLMCQERYRKDGRWHWKDKRGHRPEEEWMCLAYAYAALMGLRVSYKKRWGDLNLAATYVGVSSMVIDPTTGPFAYTGDDLSAPAIMAKEAEALRIAQASQSSISEQNMNAATEVKVPQLVGGAMKRKKKRRGGIHAYA